MNRMTGALVLSDLRSLTLAVVVATFPSWPNFALRTGAAVCVLLLATTLPHVRLSRSDLFAFLFAVYAMCSTTWATSPAVTALGVKNTLACVAIFLATRAVVTRRRDLWLVTLGFLAGCVIAAGRLMLSNPGSRVRVEYDVNSARIGLDGINYNYLSYSLATGAALLTLLWIMRARRRPSFVLACAVVTALCYIGIILSGTRGALLSMILLGAWWLLYRFQPRIEFNVLAATMATLGTLVIVGFLDEPLRSNIGQSIRETGDLNGRLAIWPAAREAFWENPVLGRGVDAFATLSDNPLHIPAHNVWLDLATGLGIIGVGLFTATLWTAVFRDPRGLPYVGQRVLVQGSFVAAATPIMLSGYWVESPSLWLSIALVSLLPLAAQGDQDSDPDDSTATFAPSDRKPIRPASIR